MLCALARGLGRREQGIAQSRDTGIVGVLCADGMHRPVFEAVSGEEVVDLVSHCRAPRGIDGVDLGQRHGTLVQAEQFNDFEVFPSLRHRPVVGGDDQQGEVDAGAAGEHGVDEPLVAGDVDEANAAARRLGTVEVSVAEVKGDAAGFLFLEPVAVHAGQGFDQRGLAVVDVACGADDHVVSPGAG